MQRMSLSVKNVQSERVSAESKLDTRVYASDLVVIGENSTVPSNVTVGRNVAISGKTVISDYPDGKLESGDYIIKAGEI